MKNKILKYIVSFIFTFAILISNSYASTNHRFFTDDEINNYTKFEIDEYNYENIKNTPIVNCDEKVYDFGELLTDEEEQELYNSINEFIAETNLDCFVVTLRDVNAYDYKDIIFVDDFYDYNDFGKGTTRDGIGILIDIRNDTSGNRFVYVTTTGQAILLYDNYRIDQLVNAFLGWAGNTIDYYNGTYAIIERAKDYYYDGIPSSNLDAWIDDDGNYHYESGHHRSLMSPFEKIKAGFAASVGIAFIVTLIFFFVNKSALDNKKIASLATLYLKKDSVNYNERSDNFVTSHTTSYKISSDSSSSGGGSSHHSSSSGGSHGGGGGHF